MNKKTCSKCGKNKSLIEFYVDTHLKSGHKSQCITCQKEYYTKNRRRIIKYCRKYRVEKRVFIKKLRRLRYIKNRKRDLETNRAYCKNNIEKVRKRRRTWLKNNPEYYKNRLKNPLIKLTHNIRNLTNKALKNRGYRKNSKTFKIVGCSYIVLKNYLFKKAKIRYKNFKEEDYLKSRKYSIDHIMPLSTCKNKNEIIRLFNYKNLQILLTKENIAKGNKIL